MFNTPRPLILQQLPLPLPQHPPNQPGHARLVTEFGDRREERFEVEDDGGGEGKAAEGLPVDAEVDVF